MSLTNPLEGRLEVCLNGTWGTVCNRGWGSTDSQVVCRQLGYSSLGESNPTYETRFLYHTEC